MRLASITVLFATALTGYAQPARPALLRNAGLDQKMGAEIPLDQPFLDDTGKNVTLRQYAGKPMVLALVYYQCPSLCNLILNGALRSLQGVPLNAGEDYNFVAVSFDPRETREMAAAKKANYAAKFGGQSGASASQGWHFLTGDQESSRALANAVGFHYVFDSNANQYIHPSLVTLLTPGGRVSRYLLGVEYPPRDMRLGLVEASNGTIGTPVDQVLLYCFHYDAATGKYGLVIMNVLRLGGLLTVAVLALFLLLNLRRDWRTT